MINQPKKVPQAKEKELQKKISELEEQLKQKEEQNQQLTSKNQTKYKGIIDQLNCERQDCENEIENQKRKIQQSKLEIDSYQDVIKNINKKKAEIEEENFDLNLDNEYLRLQIKFLLRRINNSTQTQTINLSQTRDSFILYDESSFMNEQLTQQKEQIKKIKEEFNNKLQQLEDKINDLEKNLQTEKQQTEKEHNNFLNEVDENVKLKKQIKAKSDQIKQLEQQQENNYLALSQSNFEISKLMNVIKNKDLDISSLNDDINIIKQQNQYVKQQLLNQTSNSTVNILQDNYFLELEQQQEWLKQKQKENKNKLQQEIQLQEQQQKDKLEKEQQKIFQQNQENKQLIEQNIQQAKKECGQLDVCFIVDVTGSMDSYKEQTKMSVLQSLQIIKSATNRDTNWASVCYQDKAELQQLQKYYEFPFSKDKERLQQFFDGIQCDGGGDGPEDIRGAIKQVCKLNWPSKFRIAILICDAPCHGRKYHEGYEDDYPDEDIEDAIQELIQKDIILIALNFTTDTSKMYEEIQKIYESKKKLEQYLYQDLQNINLKDLAAIMSRFIGDASKIATQTNKSQTKSKEGVNIQKNVRVREGAMEALCKQDNFYNFEQQKDVKIVDTKFKVFRVEIKQEEFNKNIQTINNIQCPQDFLVTEEGNWDCIRTEKPFAFGMMKDVFLMKKKKDYSNELYVIKTPIGSQPYKTMTLALNECRSHLICQKLMKKFVDELQQQKSEKYVNITIPSVIYSDFLILKDSQDTFWIAERFFKGEFVKYNNNYGYINTDHDLELNKFAQSFTYYTFFISGTQYMVCDIQGVGNYFTDPAINTQTGLFDDTDMGRAGQQMYLVNYENQRESLTKKYLELLDIYK